MGNYEQLEHLSFNEKKMITVDVLRPKLFSISPDINSRKIKLNILLIEHLGKKSKTLSDFSTYK